MRQECPYDLYLLRVFDIPKKYHLVAVNCYNSMPLFISYHSQHVRELAGLALGHLYLFYAGLDVSLAERRWLLQRHDVLQRLRAKESDHTIGASAKQVVIT